MKAIVYIATSLDGFIAGKDGDISWLAPFESAKVSKQFEAFMARVDVIVIGRYTFETVLTFPDWPYRKPVIVLSDTLNELPGHLKGKAALLSLPPEEVLAWLKAGGYRSAYIDGGKTIQRFLQHDCIDEMNITRVPLLLGSGISLFGSLDHAITFIHNGTEYFENGLVTSNYVRVHE